MNPPRLNFVPALLISLLIWASVDYEAMAQESETDLKLKQTNYPHVEWVKNWPSADKNNYSKSLKYHINSFFFGIKPPALSYPVAVSAFNPDEYWILDQKNKTIFQIIQDLGDIPHPIAKTDLDLSSLVGICAGPNSSILFTDSRAQKVFLISPEKKKLQILNDTLVLEQPTGIAYSYLKKEIWVIETKAHRIAVLNENGDLIKRVGSRGNTPGKYNYPTHIWIDKRGFIYINDAMNFRIQVLNPEGEVISVFGEAGDASGSFARPKGIATDSFGNIYVVDALFHVVQVFDMKGNFLYKFGNQGHGNAEFWMPTGIFIDDRDYIYVADSYNSRVQVFQLIHSDGK